jgi:uncharacterized protein (DUF1330 family)
MSAYWLARARVIDPVAYRHYREATKVISPNYPRKVLARGGRFQVLEGKTHFERFVILEYPSFDAALRYFNSPEFQSAIALRHGASENETVLVEGVTDGVGTDV